jgi:CIC family chloride channel protein
VDEGAGNTTAASGEDCEPGNADRQHADPFAERPASQQLIDVLFARTLRHAIALRRRLRQSEATFILLAVVVGSIGGGLSVALGGAAHTLQRLLFDLPGDMRLSAAPHLAPIRLLALPLGGALLGLLQLALERWRRRTPVDVVEANALHGGAVPWRDSLTVTGQTFASNGFGASVGLEAAYAQIGGGLGSVVGRWLNLRRSDLRILVGAGAGAAIGAAFGAPLTGAFYAFEIVIGAYTPAAIAPVAAAAIAGVATARSMGSVPYLITVDSTGITRNLDYLAFIGIGLVCALAGIALMRAVSLLEAGVRWTRLPPALRPFVGGVLLMPIAYVSPQALSAGHGALHLALAGDAPLAMLCLIFGLKWLASSVSLGFSFRGGLFFASLFLGVLIGRIYGDVTDLLLPGQHLWTQDAALVGMAALAVSVIGGPMTMTFLVLEATRDFQLAAIVLTASLVASALVRELFGYSFSTWRLHLRGEIIHSARDIGWVRQLTAGRMMRKAPVTMPATTTIAEFRRLAPLGSTSRVVLLDDKGHYGGIVATAQAYIDGVDVNAEIATLARRPDETIEPNRNVAEVMQVFDRLGVDELAVVADGALLGILTEAHVRKRYSDELERSQRELFGEA